jgi:hypothetical protein
VLGVSTVGGLAGWNQDEISSCYSTADVAGEKGVGGLVGLNTTISSWWGLVGTITNCYATGLVLGDSNVGGLVGVNEHGAVIASSYGTGAVGGSQMTAGGLVGSADANDVVASFWDTQTSGPTTIAVGTGKTTAEMQTAKTFLDAGWDFVGESQNGTENIWAICEGLDYPKLAWQFVIGDYNGDNQADFMDFCIFGQHWLGTDSSFWCGAGGKDLTSDGFVDFEDLMVLADNWLRGFD